VSGKSLLAGNEKNFNEKFMSTVSGISTRSGQAVFRDIITLLAISVANCNELDGEVFKAREPEYMSICQNYSEDERQLLPKIAGVIISECVSRSQDPTDILGELYHNLKANDKEKDQFFTPSYAADAMGSITLDNAEFRRTLDAQGHVKVLDYCVGSGALPLGYAGAVSRAGFDTKQDLFIKGVDVDEFCVKMCYLQMSLYGIPAIIVNGNGLSGEVWSVWKTPAFLEYDLRQRSRLIKARPTLLKNDRGFNVKFEQLDLWES